MVDAVTLDLRGLAVGRARLSGPGANRALLEQALGEVALDRLGLGAEEILYVPRLTGPSRLRAGATQHFASGLALVLGEIAQRAERDPPGAGATDRPCRFSNRAAFAAWLIGALLEKSRAEATNLVRAATGRASPQDWWRRDVLDEGRSLVPVLVRLAEAGKAVRWLARLEAFEIRLAADSLACDYGLTLADVADREVFARPPAARPIPAAHPLGAGAARQERVTSEAVRTVRDAIAARDEQLAALPVAARRLLVAAMVLARAPSAPRAALAWEISRQIGEERPSSSAGPPFVVADAMEEDVGAAPAPRSAGVVPARSASTVSPPRPRMVAALAPGRFTPPPIAADRVPDGHAHPAAAETAEISGTMEPSVEIGAPSLPRVAWNPFADPPDGEILAALSAPQAAFETEFGGLAFLVNAFLAMGLCPDFTRPLDPALALPPLALADRLGRHWFGARYRRDPFRRWIAGRGPQAALPRRWRAEHEWLSPFPDGHSWHDGSTLRHSDGFPLANRCGAVLARRLAGALDVPLVSRAPGRSRSGAGHNPAWLECLALFLAARLRRAAPDDALAPAALAIPAHVVVSEARIDFHFALAALPLALRLAGLDRDPGWLPTEGRDLRFHFA